MKQDFSKKLTIAVRADIAAWQSMNAVAHISAYFGNQLKNAFSTDEYFVTKDKRALPRNSQYGIVVLSATQDQIASLVATAETQSDLSWMAFTREMIDYIDDAELAKDISTKQTDEIEFLGVGLFGDKQQLQRLTKNLQLWK